MGRLSAEEIERDLDVEMFLSDESLSYRIGRGSSGIQLNIKTCPACGDSRWRTYFGVETGRGNCFVCNQGFSKIGFVHMALGNEGQGKGGWRATFQRIDELMAAQGWQRIAKKPVIAVDMGRVELPRSIPLPTPAGETLLYLDQRGFGPEICTYFHLSYCQHGWWIYEEDGQSKTQTFDGRVIIPVFDLDGTLVTFQGRDVTGTSDRKYLFPKALPGTGRFLYNAHNHIHETHAVMGEGVFDVAAIKLAVDADPEFEPVLPIGSFGKHLSHGALDGNDQLSRLRRLRDRGLKRVTMMWDGEKKALEAALDACRLIAGTGLEARVAFLPKDKDPNEVDGETVRRAILTAKTWSPTADLMLRLKNPY